MKKIIWIVILVVVVGLGIWLLLGNSLSQQPASTQNNNSTTTTGVVPDNNQVPSNQAPTSTGKLDSSKNLTMAEVAKHGTAESCFTVINGFVYDLTSFIDKHPGGSQKILPICGKDGTSAFNSKHSGQTKPEQTLAQLKIGILAK
jgi:cytochrome b involved in lipid metabolism